MNTTVNKAVVAFLTSLVALIGALQLADLSWATEGLVAAVGAVVSAFLVWLIPNKEPEPPAE